MGFPDVVGSPVHIACVVSALPSSKPVVRRDLLPGNFLDSTICSDGDEYADSLYLSHPYDPSATSLTRMQQLLNLP